MLTYHSGLRFQQGRGFGSFFGSILRSLKPIAKMGLNAGKKLIQSDFVKKLGNTALDVGKQAATNIAVDVLEGKNLKDSAQEQLEEAKKQIATTLKGGGCAKKRKKKKLVFDLSPKKLKYNLLD